MTSTPGWAVTRRTYFSPRKFLYQRKLKSAKGSPCQVPERILQESRIGRIRTQLGLAFGIPDLHIELAGFIVLLNVDVDGKVSVDVAHLVLEALGDTDDQVVDDSTDGTESSDTLANTVVHLNRDDILLGAAEGDSDVGEVLDELA